MAQARGIRMHCHLDNWLIRVQTKESCHQDTQSPLALCQELGCVVNLTKLEPKQIFDFVGYQYDLLHGLVRPTQSRWEYLQQKLASLMSKSTCQIRQFMSLIGLLTATEKQSHYAGSSGMSRIIGGFQSPWKRKSQSPGLCTHTFSGGPKRQTSFQLNLCTPFSMPFRSLQTPQMKDGVLTEETTQQTKLGQFQKASYT